MADAVTAGSFRDLAEARSQLQRALYPPARAVVDAEFATARTRSLPFPPGIRIALV